jgi:protein Mpv17
LFAIDSKLTVTIAIFGPAASAWYGVLQRHVVLKSTAATVVARVAADQLLFTPVNLFCFLSSMSIMEGTDPMEKLRKAYWSTYKTNLGVWSTVQLGNFALVPLEYRVLVVNVVSLGWNCYLSYVNSKA